MRRSLLLAAAVIAVVVAQPASPPSIAAAQTENRAAVVVDTGDGQVRRACLVFSDPSVTGLDVLRAAQMDPVVQTYSGQGGAVCKLCGVGCSAGSSCLTCQSPNYWQYWRGDNGGSYAYSRSGAGSTAVTNGDVEGWRWGSDQSPPPLYSVSDICSDPTVPTYRVSSSSNSSPTTSAPARTTTTTTGTASPGSPGAPGATAPPAGGGGTGGGPVTTAARTPSGAVPSATTLRPASPDDPTAAPVTTMSPGGDAAATTSTSSSFADAGDDTGTSDERDEGDEQDGLAAGDRGVAGSNGASSTIGYAAFAVLLGGLAGASFWVRHRRRRHEA